ncbi:MAG TPA: dihydrofolate reductase family protein [Kofleriaceae bacterium]|nr:dihydrofolate reductase family protein [Kofleriaceae bacterium]
MRTLKYNVATSLDGFIARPDDSYDAFLQEGDFALDYVDSWSGYDTVLMGRRTYEIGLKVGVTNPYPTLRTFVFSRTLAPSPDPAVTVIASDPVAAVRELKAQPGRAIYLCGGGVLAALLHGAGLIDEIIVKLNPVLLGDGIRLFGDALPTTRLALRDARVYPSGVVVLAYRVPR